MKKIRNFVNFVIALTLITSLVIAITPFRPKTDIDLQGRYSIYDLVYINTTNKTFIINTTDNDIFFRGNIHMNTTSDHVAEINNSGFFTEDNITSNFLLSQGIKVQPKVNLSSSTSIGGAIFLTNTLNSGAGFIAYTNFGAGASGRLMNLRVDNNNFDQALFHADYDGTANAVEIDMTNNDSSAQTLAITSDNELDTALGVTGKTQSRAVLKINHEQSGHFKNDTNAAGLTIELRGNSTSAQGIFIDTRDNITHGKLINARNDGTEKFVINQDGNVSIRTSDYTYALNINGSSNISDSLWVNGFGFFTGMNVTNTSNTGSAPIMSINSGEGATNFLNFNNNFFMGKQVDVFGFHTYSPNEVLGMGTNGLLNVFTLNGGTGRATVTGRNTVFITTINSTGNASLAQNERVIFPVGNATHLSITSTADPKKGFHFLGENNINVVINAINSYNFTPNELGAGNRNVTFDKWKDDKSCLDLNHTHNGTGCGGVAIPHDEFRPSRTFDTVYFNNNSRSLIIYGSIIQTVDLANDKGYITAYTGTSNPPTTKIQTVGFYNVPAITVNRTDSFYFVVQPKQFYALNRTTAGSGTVNLDVWNEVDL